MWLPQQHLLEGWLPLKICIYLEAPSDIGLVAACARLANAVLQGPDHVAASRLEEKSGRRAVGRLLRFQHLAVPCGDVDHGVMRWASRRVDVDSLVSLRLPVAPSSLEETGQSSANAASAGRSGGSDGRSGLGGEQSRAAGQLLRRFAGEGGAAWVAWLLAAQFARSSACASSVLLSRGAALPSDEAEHGACVEPGVAALVDLSLPLRGAASSGHSGVVRLLLGALAPLDKVDENECTVLHFAADRGHASVCHELLLWRAHVDARDDDDWTPLNLAADEGHTDACKVLLQARAGVNIPDEDSRSPLWWASFRHHADIARLLLDFQADPLQADDRGVAATRSWRGPGAQ